MMIFRISTTLALLLAAQAVWGHGFNILLDANQLTSSSATFVRELDPPPLNSMTHGFFNKVDGQFDSSDTFRFDIVSPLFYSNGSGAELAASGVSVTGYSLASLSDIPTSSQVMSDATGAPSGLFVGSVLSTHGMEWVLSDTAPHGVYGFAYQISGYAAGDFQAPYDPVTVVLGMHTDAFDGDPNMALAQQQVLEAAAQFATASAVPEPASWLLGFISALALAGLAWRRRRAKV